MWPEERTRTSDVMAASHSSRESTMSGFDPENEAMASSTKHLDQDQEHDLPTPKHVSRTTKPRNSPAQQEDPDFAIDTSALHRAFPDFPAISSSDDDEDDDFYNDGIDDGVDDGSDDISVELGRGARKSSRHLDDSRGSTISINDGHLVSSPAKEARLNSPAKPALQNISSRISAMGRDSLRKGAQIRRASLVQKENQAASQEQKPKTGYTSKSRNISGAQRRSLSEMHAKATETYEGSYISDERPENATVTTKNTRFANRRHEQNVRLADAVNLAAGKMYLQTNGRKDTMSSDDSEEDNNTHQSFVLPDIANLSELVSGVYQDGTPKQTRPRNTRFASPPTTAVTSSRRPDHAILGGVPVPDDEKAIFASLRSLQEKVAQLEGEKDEAEAKIDDLRQEYMDLKAEAARQQEEESRQYAVRTASDRGQHRTSGKLVIEKNSKLKPRFLNKYGAHMYV